MGGPSAERKVSLASGVAVSAALREAGYDVVDVKMPDRTLTLPDEIEAVFIALHGTFGEDGGIQTLLEERGVPYVGSGPEGSRIAFDKHESKRVFEQESIPTAPYEVLTESRASSLALPVVIKPVRQGSTIGVHRVFDEKDWPDALRDAMSYDGAVLVEPYIAGKELTVGILGDLELPVIEIRAPDDWYDYEAKYSAENTEYVVPAPLSAGQTKNCQQIARRAFAGMGCRGFGRVDFRMSPQGELFVLEVNTIPGFTETSLVPKAAAAAGINFSQLCSRILEDASLS